MNKKAKGLILIESLLLSSIDKTKLLNDMIEVTSGLPWFEDVVTHAPATPMVTTLFEFAVRQTKVNHKHLAYALAKELKDSENLRKVIKCSAWTFIDVALSEGLISEEDVIRAAATTPDHLCNLKNRSDVRVWRDWLKSAPPSLADASCWSEWSRYIEANQWIVAEDQNDVFAMKPADEWTGADVGRWLQSVLSMVGDHRQAGWRLQLLTTCQSSGKMLGALLRPQDADFFAEWMGSGRLSVASIVDLAKFKTPDPIAANLWSCLISEKLNIQALLDLKRRALISNIHAAKPKNFIAAIDSAVEKHAAIAQPWLGSAILIAASDVRLSDGKKEHSDAMITIRPPPKIEKSIRASARNGDLPWQQPVDQLVSELSGVAAANQAPALLVALFAWTARAMAPEDLIASAPDLLAFMDKPTLRFGGIALGKITKEHTQLLAEALIHTIKKQHAKDHTPGLVSLVLNMAMLTGRDAKAMKKVWMVREVRSVVMSGQLQTDTVAALTRWVSTVEKDIDNPFDTEASPELLAELSAAILANAGSPAQNASKLSKI